MNAKPLLVYLHRYPPEYEAVQYPVMPLLFARLLEKCDILYISMRGTKPPSPEIRRGLRVIELPLRVNTSSGPSKLIKTALYYLYLPFLLRQIKRARPDLIVCQESLPFIPILVGRLGVPTMMGGFGDFWWRIILGGWPLGNRVADWMERFEIRQWRRLKIAIITTTRAETEFIIRRGMDPGLIHPINATGSPGIFFPYPARAEREQMGFTPEHWVAAIHGTIRQGKGYGQLLEWWRELVRLHPNWRLLIIGGAGQEAWCRRQIRRLGLDAHVHMTGWLATQNDVNRYLNAADCLLVIRRNSDDNQGIIPGALPHSLATGKPTVAIGLAGIAEVIRHGVDGFLFKPDDYDSFRSVLEYVAGHPEEASRVGQAGMAREKEYFDEKVTTAKVAEMIERMTTRSSQTANAVL